MPDRTEERAAELEDVPKKAASALRIMEGVYGVDWEVVAYQDDDLVTQTLARLEDGQYVVSWTDGWHGGFEHFAEYGAALAHFCEEALGRTAEDAATGTEPT